MMLVIWKKKQWTQLSIDSSERNREPIASNFFSLSLPLLFFSSFLVVFCCYRHHSFALSWLYKNGMKNEPRNVYTNIVILWTRAILKSSYRKNNNRMVWEYEHTNQKKRGAVEEKKCVCRSSYAPEITEQMSKIQKYVLAFFLFSHQYILFLLVT